MHSNKKENICISFITYMIETKNMLLNSPYSYDSSFYRRRSSKTITYILVDHVEKWKKQLKLDNYE